MSEYLEPIRPEHPVFDFPRGEEAEEFLRRFGAEGWNKMIAARNARIELEMHNPYEGRVQMPIWHVADFITGAISWEEFAANRKPDGSPWELPIPEEWICDELRREFEGSPADMLHISGGNRSTKTTYCLDRAFRALRENYRARLWLFHSNMGMSKEYHQLPIYELMPESDKKIGKGTVGYVSFKEQTGFADYTFRLRNGSACWFHSYEEDLGFAEGGELGAMSRKRTIGYIADENCPMLLLDKLRARISTRNSIGLHPYTAVDGYTPLVRWFRQGARTVMSAVAKYAGKERELPIVESKVVKVEGLPAFKIATVFFWSEWNPYGNFDQLRRTHAMDTERVKLVKFYGFAQTETNAIFPKLDERIHGFNDEDLPEEGTNYHYVDPCGMGRNWFMLWIRVDIYGRKWVYREWPCEDIPIPNVGTPGPWAVEGEDKTHKYGGLIGDGQRGFGFGFLDYKNEIARLEGWKDCLSAKKIEEWDEANGSAENVVGRKIDSRYANTPHGRADGQNTTLIDECKDIRLYFESASGKDISEGIAMINSQLAYREREDGRLEELPMLMISRKCKNLWFAMRNWTGLGGGKEATKDPVDTLRYGITDDPQYMDPNVRNTGPWGGRVKSPRKNADSLRAFFKQ